MASPSDQNATVPAAAPVPAPEVTQETAPLPSSSPANETVQNYPSAAAPATPQPIMTYVNPGECKCKLQPRRKKDWESSDFWHAQCSPLAHLPCCKRAQFGIV